MGDTKSHLHYALLGRGNSLYLFSPLGFLALPTFSTPPKDKTFNKAWMALVNYRSDNHFPFFAFVIITKSLLAIIGVLAYCVTKAELVVEIINIRDKWEPIALHAHVRVIQ